MSYQLGLRLIAKEATDRLVEEIHPNVNQLYIFLNSKSIVNCQY